MLVVLMLGLPLAGCLENITGSDEVEEVIDELIDGCTDSNAVNYDSTANNDDGSCEYATAKNFVDALFAVNPVAPVLNNADARMGVVIQTATYQNGEENMEVKQFTMDPANGDLLIQQNQYSEKTNSTNESESSSDTSVRRGDVIVRQHKGENSVTARDGMYVPHGESRAGSTTESPLEWANAELGYLRTPHCVHDLGVCGTWPLCYEPVPGTDCSGTTTSASSSTSGRGGGDGWPVGMYAYQWCALNAGTWVNTHPTNPTANPNVGYCVYDILPEPVVATLLGSGDATGIEAHLEKALEDASKEYSQSGDITSWDSWSAWSSQQTMMFTFSNGLNLDITMNMVGDLVRFTTYSGGDNQPHASFFGLDYLIVDDRGDDGNGGEVTRAYTGGNGLELTIEERGYYWYDCPPTVMMPLGVTFYPSSSTTPTEYCDNMFGSVGPGQGSGVGFIGDEMPIEDIREDIDEIIGGNTGVPISPGLLSLRFTCSDSSLVWLGQTQDGVSDCPEGADESFDSSSGLTFVVSDEQIERPPISAFEVLFIASNSTGEGWDNVTGTTVSWGGGGSSSDEAQQEENSRAAQTVRTAEYRDTDRDGRISPGDVIVLTFPTGESALFIDRTADYFAPLQINAGDVSNTDGGIGTRDMTCEEQSDDLCTASWTYQDPVTGSWVTRKWCEMRPEGYDCNGNPTAVDDM
ncbi:MAG: hypothetical protein CMA10_03585 [Euryarchaeota archaeon]|nr:hypothetical protein [Euryarchaeota archaeon]